MAPIEDRLEYTLRAGVIECGDSFERSVAARQVKEAVQELRRLRKLEAA